MEREPDNLLGRNGKLYRYSTRTKRFEPVTTKRIRWQGRIVSVSILAHWFEYGEWLKRAPKEKRRFRAVVREGKRIVSLGYHYTREERDATVMNYRLFGMLPK